MDEITLDDKTYVSSKRAAQITGYAKDYVGQLCREGRVEARLVGRNWYVLESSIQDHRFGSTTAPSVVQNTPDEVNTAQNSTWIPTNYTTEVSPELIPTLTPHQNAPETQNSYEKPRFDVFYKSSAVPVSSEVVKEMQSAWHDWFSKTNELEVSKEILLENTSETEDSGKEPVEEVVMLNKTSSVATEKPLEAHSAHEFADSTPITLEKVAEAIENRAHVIEPEEEIVPIHRSYKAPAAYVAPASYKAEVARPIAEPQGRVLRERRVIQKKRTNGWLRALLALIGLAVVVTTVLASGVLDPYFAKHNINYRAVQFLGGESSIQK